MHLEEVIIELDSYAPVKWHGTEPIMVRICIGDGDGTKLYEIDYIEMQPDGTIIIGSV